MMAGTKALLGVLFLRIYSIVFKGIQWDSVFAG